jgi:hypothetical protein
VVVAFLIGCGGAPSVTERAPARDVPRATTTAEHLPPATEPGAERPARATRVHCVEEMFSTCTEYATAEIDVDFVHVTCETTGRFAEGECPAEDRLGYCDVELARVYGYWGANLALLERIQCSGSEWIPAP